MSWKPFLSIWGPLCYTDGEDSPVFLWAFGVSHTVKVDHFEYKTGPSRHGSDKANPILPRLLRRSQ